MKNIAVCDGFIRLEPGCYSMGVSGPELTASGNPLLLNSAEAPLTSLTVYGWSKQDGTPSPDNPVPIVSAGDSGEIGVTVQGGNLVDESQLKQGYIRDDSGKIADTDNVRYRSFVINVAPGEYTLSSNVNLLNIRVLRDGTNSVVGTSITPEKPYTLSVAKSGLFGMSFRRSDSEPWDDSIKIMLNSGSTPLSYEPYKPIQTLTIQTPNGLPGIPVNASELPKGMEPTYVDDSGQAWVCDEVDFKRGKYVQRVWRKTFDGTESWNIYGSPTSNFHGFMLGILPESSYRKSGFCNQFIVSNIAHENTEEIWLGVNNNSIYCVGVSFYDPSLEDFGLSNWKAHLAAHPLEVMTYLETPIETDLSDEELAAYKALHTYSPATTVSNDAAAWMKVGYYSNAALEKMSREALKINGGNLK